MLCNNMIYLVAMKIESCPRRLCKHSRLCQAIHSREVRVARMKISKKKIEKHLNKRIPISFLQERNIYKNECSDFKRLHRIVEKILKYRKKHYGTMVCDGFSSKLMPAAVKLHFFLRRRLLETILNK